MVLPLVMAIVGALLAALRFVLVIRLQLAADAFTTTLVKLVDARNLERAQKLCLVARGMAYGEMCHAAMAAFTADPLAEPLAATAAAERAFAEEQRRQAARLGGIGRALGMLALLLGLSALAVALPNAPGMGELLVPTLLVGGFAVLAAGTAERKASAMIRVSGEQFPALLQALGASGQRTARDRIEAAEAAERERRARAVAMQERAEREARAEVARQEELRLAAEELVASSRTVCRFCARPYLARELACPACGGPSAR